MLREVVLVRTTYTGSLWYEPPVKIKHTKETSEVFDQDRLLETVDRHGSSTFS
jgi:hypothetical protein